MSYVRRVASSLLGSHVFAMTSSCRKRSQGPSFLNDMSLIMRALQSLFPDHLPKAPTSNTITLGDGFSHRNWKGDLTFQPKHLAAEQMAGSR